MKFPSFIQEARAASPMLSMLGLLGLPLDLIRREMQHFVENWERTSDLGVACGNGL
jgi:hypothetical protein